MLAFALFVLGFGAGLIADQVARGATRGDSDTTAADRGGPRRRAAIALVTALAFALTSGVVGTTWVLPSYLWFVWLTVTLTITDLDAKLIPNRILLPGTAVGGALLAAGALGDGEFVALARAAAGAIASFLVLYLVARLARGDFGLGDVKLSFLLGLFTAYQGWAELAVGFVTAFVLGGLVSVFLLATRQRRRKDAIPFGPYLVAGAYVGLAWGRDVADWYLGAAG
jgi:leader peptidase (prepilin peptidase)/N-methyltransferase